MLITYFWLYPIATVTGYLGHLKFSFAYKGNRNIALIRYAFAYLRSYGVNLIM